MTLNSNEHRIIIGALETYQSMWAAAVTEAQRENEPIDERFARERYEEAVELWEKFTQEPEGGDALAMIGKLDANVAAEQARDRRRTVHFGNGLSMTITGDKAMLGRLDRGVTEAMIARDVDELERLDHNLDDLRSADEGSEDE